MKRRYSDSALAEVIEAVDVLVESVHNEESHVQESVRPVSAEKIVRIAKHAFTVILSYLKSYYKQEYGVLVSHQSVRDIRRVMQRVHDTTKELERYALLKPEKFVSIKNMREFRELANFYEKKILPITLQESLEQWMLYLPVKAVIDSIKEQKKTSKNIIIDPRSIARDEMYELFFLQKEDGSRFFNSSTVRYLQMQSNLLHHAEAGLESSFTAQIDAIFDKTCREIAEYIYHSSYSEIDDFTHAVYRCASSDPFSSLYKAIIALMLAAAQPSKHVEKSSKEYFFDFIALFHECTLTEAYQKIEKISLMVASQYESVVLRVMHAIGYSLFTAPSISQALVEFFEHIDQHDRVELSSSQRLEACKRKIDKSVRDSANIALRRNLDDILDERITGFCSLFLHNFAGFLYNITIHSKNIAIYRLPSPTYQQYCNEAHVLAEWKEFLRYAVSKNRSFTYLVYDFQDRTNAIDVSRIQVIEELQKQAEFAPHIRVVTLSRDGDFYHQDGVYKDLHNADQFIATLLECMMFDPHYHFSDSVQKLLFPSMLSDIALWIHRTFFNGVSTLPRALRQDFIELFYLMIQVVIAQKISPDAIGFMCKDGLDSSLPAAHLFTYFCHLFENPHISPCEENYMKCVLFGLPLLYRGRALFSDSLMRMLSAQRIIENMSIPVAKFLS